MAVVRLEKWSTKVAVDPYQAPELAVMRLHGEVYGHPYHSDGMEVTTSAIIEVNGKEITTASGTVYLLGEVDPDFEKWYNEESTGLCDLRSENPFSPKEQENESTISSLPIT